MTPPSLSELSSSAQLIRDFVNSSEPQVGSDELDDPVRAEAWLTAHGLLGDGGRVEPRQLADLVRVREGLRSLLAVNAGHDADPTALDGLNDVLRKAPVIAQFDLNSTRRLVGRRNSPVDRAVAALLSATSTAVENDEWPRLKVCARDSCRWAFYDASRNRSGRWCSMSGCGNIVKMRRAHQARRP